MIMDKMVKKTVVVSALMKLSNEWGKQKFNKASRPSVILCLIRQVCGTLGPYQRDYYQEFSRGNYI